MNFVSNNCLRLKWARDPAKWARRESARSRWKFSNRVMSRVSNARSFFRVSGPCRPGTLLVDSGQCLGRVPGKRGRGHESEVNLPWWLLLRGWNSRESLRVRSFRDNPDLAPSDSSPHVSCMHALFGRVTAGPRLMFAVAIVLRRGYYHADRCIVTPSLARREAPETPPRARRLQEAHRVSAD